MSPEPAKLVPGLVMMNVNEMCPVSCRQWW